MIITKLNRPDIASSEVRAALQQRNTPYYQMIGYSRHIGYLKHSSGDAWYARIRTRAESYYRRRLGLAEGPTAPDGLTFERAMDEARKWFASSGISPWAADTKPMGIREELIVCPIAGEFSIAHAMHEYVEWKRIAAAKSHFQTNLSLINYHIIPRLAHMPVVQFNGEHLRKFVREVLETPPKRGKQPLGKQRSIDSLDAEHLRKRKKTVNTLIGILRVAFQMAWENGKIDSDRAWRCLRRLPAVDRPRVLHLSRAECRELIKCCRPDVARLVLGALYTGCRANELTTMQCGDIGRDGYGIYISPSKKISPGSCSCRTKAWSGFWT